MKRKVVLHGPSTLIVSLPSKWTKTYNIKAGDEIDVEEEGRILKLFSGAAITQPEFHLNISRYGPLIPRLIMGLYHAGYDHLNLSYDNENAGKEIERILKETIGFEIVHRKEGECTVKDITGSGAGEFDTTLRRLFILVKFSVESLAKTLEDRNQKSVTNIIENDFEINKLANFCIRQVNKRMAGSQHHATYFLIIHQLERIGDACKEIAKTMLGSSAKVSKEVLLAAEAISALFGKSYEYHYQKKLSLALEVAQLNDESDRLLRQPPGLNPTEAAIIASLKSMKEQTITIQGVQLTDMRQ